MNDENLELLLTLDYPWYGPDEDIFHLQLDHAAGYWPSLSFHSTFTSAIAIENNPGQRTPSPVQFSHPGST